MCTDNKHSKKITVLVHKEKICALYGASGEFELLANILTWSQKTENGDVSGGKKKQKNKKEKRKHEI